MLTELLTYLRNWFVKTKYSGRFTISNGELQLQYVSDGATKQIELLDGQYFRIIGGVFNEGVHAYNSSGLTDETFEGAVWSLAIPHDVIILAEDIQNWQDKYGSADSQAMSPFSGETLDGVYSYSKGGSSSGVQGSGISWQDVFGARLSLWRKL